VNGVLPLLPKTIQQPRVDKFDPTPHRSERRAYGRETGARHHGVADKVLRRQIESVAGVGRYSCSAAAAPDQRLARFDRLRSYT